MQMVLQKTNLIEFYKITVDMTRRNNKRNNRRNRQRNNTPELLPFAQMLFGAIVGKGVDMIARKMAEYAGQETSGIHAEGISDQGVTNTSNGKATSFKLRIPADGSAVEYPVPGNLRFFFDEEGKLMVRQKIEGDGNPTDTGEGKPVTYDDICKKLFSGMIAYRKSVKCTTPGQAKRLGAYNKLINIARFLNGDWKPDFHGDHENWNICKDGDAFIAMYTKTLDKGSVYFRNEELADEAIRLMGEESLGDLFSTDW